MARVLSDASPWLLFVAACCSRIWVTRHDQPYGTHPDEFAIFGAAERTLDGAGLNPEFFNYPSFLPYVEALVLYLGRGAGVIGEGFTYEAILGGRLVVAIMGGVTAGLVYLAGRAVEDRVTGLVAGALLATCQLHFAQCYSLTVDAPTACWVALVVVAAMRLLANGRSMWPYLIGGLAAGLAASTKYTGGLSAVMLVLAHFVGSSEKDNRALDPRALLMLVAIGVGFLAVTPYAVIDWPRFRAALEFESRHYGGGHPGFEAPGRVSYLQYAVHLLEGAPVLATLGLLGMIVGVARRKTRRQSLVLLVFALGYFAFIGSYRVHFARNLMPILPVLALLAGIGARSVYALLVDRQRFAAYGVAAVLGAALLFVGVRAANEVRVLQTPDTRILARRWMVANFPDGSWVVRDLHTVPPPGVRGITDMGGHHALVIARPHPRADYIVTCSEDYDRYLDNAERYPRRAQRYQRLFEQHEEVARFEEDRVHSHGPTVIILRAQY